MGIHNLKSWKTTLFGILAALVGVAQGIKIHSWSMALRDPTVQLAIASAVIGVMAKDSNVTGGTVGQPSTPEALTAANQAPSPIAPPKQ